MVQVKGVEPLHRLALDPKSSASANSATSAYYFFLVEDGGFEPPKAMLTDLQSAPFGRSGNPPFLELVIGLEPTTC